MIKLTDKPLVAYPNDMCEKEEGFAVTQGSVGVRKFTEAKVYAE